MDCSRPQTPPKYQSTIHRSCHSKEIGDRYYMDRNPRANILAVTPPHTSSKENSPAHIARLAKAVNISPNGPILMFHQAPSVSNVDPLLAAQRIHVQPLYSKEKASQGPGGSGSSSRTTATKKIRHLPTQPELSFDALGMLDDYYLNLLHWSSRNQLAVGLAEGTYIWNAETGSVSHLTEAPEGLCEASLEWSNGGSYLAIGRSNGDVELWDVEADKKLRTMSGHQAQVGTLSWNSHILSSGCQDGSIWHHDVRIAAHRVGTLIGHAGEVCGLKWRPDGMFLASGGNDNVVNIWDGRIGDVELSEAKFTKRSHTAAVKALAWCPWQDSLLATGGGTGDATVHFWNSNTGLRTGSLTTPSPVTSIQFTPLAKEVMTTHGFPNNSVMVHSYPSLNKVGEIKDAHDARILYSSISPQGDFIATGGGDKTLNIWRLWEIPAKKKKANSFEIYNSIR